MWFFISYEAPYVFKHFQKQDRFAKKTILLFQAKVSMWSKQSETLIDNSVAYVLQNKLNILLGINEASINYDQQIETEVSFAQKLVFNGWIEMWSH